MLKKVAVGHLRIGVYIEKIDESWFSTPFLRHQFKITSEKQIQSLRDYDIKDVFINDQKGIDPYASQAGEKYKKNIEYLPVSVDHFVLNTILPFELFILKEKEHCSYLGRNFPFHSEVKLDLDANKIETVYIRASENAALRRYESETALEREQSKQSLCAGFESEEKVKAYNHYLKQFIPINAGIFEPGMTVPFDLYAEESMRVSHFVKADERIPESDFFSSGQDSPVDTRREAENRNNLLISINDQAAYKDFLERLASQKTGDDETASRRRVAIVMENSKLVAKDLVDNPRSGHAVNAAKESVNALIANVLDNRASFYGLMRINTYDYYTYVHSLNVCTLLIGLGVTLGLDNKDLRELAIGGILHDVGKSKVPASLINKPGKLTDKELSEVKNHVTRGHLILKEHRDLPKRATFPLLQHHEKLNGKGYPNKLYGDQIHLFGRIASIIDIYDALTTKRSYKKAFRAFDALNFLGNQKEAYDQVIFKAFVEMISQ